MKRTGGHSRLHDQRRTRFAVLPHRLRRRPRPRPGTDRAAPTEAHPRNSHRHGQLRLSAAPQASPRRSPTPCTRARRTSRTTRSRAGGALALGVTWTPALTCPLRKGRFASCARALGRVQRRRRGLRVRRSRSRLGRDRRRRHRRRDLRRRGLRGGDGRRRGRRRAGRGAHALQAAAIRAAHVSETLGGLSPQGRHAADLAADALTAPCRPRPRRASRWRTGRPTTSACSWR